MAASLHKLLSEEGFRTRKPNKKVKFKDQQDSIALPIYICHDRRSFDSSSRAEKSRSGSERSAAPSRNGPAIDDVAIKAMVAILSGYVGQYLRDRSFRLSIGNKCRSCFERKKKKKKEDSDDDIFSVVETEIQDIEELMEMRRENIDLESLQKSIRILNGVVLQKANSSISACANLYVSIIYKIAKNDKISARHLLQVFSESPYLARKHLLPELWEHFFLPHLLHLKIWYNKELDFVANSDGDRIKALTQQYNEQMDIGTTQFANYYKEWLKVGAHAPTIPKVPLPSKSRSRRQSSQSSTSYHSASSKSLYQAVFGPMVKGGSMDLDNNGNGASRNVWDFDVDEKVYGVEEDFKNWNHVDKKTGAHRRSSSQSYRTQKEADLWPDSKKTDLLRFLGCRTEPAECLVQGSRLSDNNDYVHPFQINGIARAIATICSSESLADCEVAIRVVSEAWLDSKGDPKIEASLSHASVILGILEVLYVSNDDEILELAVSLLAEIATKSEANRQCVLNSDPNLDVLIRLMRSSSLFLKGAALLYVVKPKAKQMVSLEWVPLVLRVLEFGDQLQTLFSVKCCPHEAAYYFLHQLLTGFDEDKNFENGKQVISLGGLSLLVRRMDVGDVSEKRKAASVLCYCIRADGSCRHYLVKNLNKETILSLLALERQTNSTGHVLELLTELLCLTRRNQRIEYLTELTKGWEGMNALQILLLRLQRARPEEGPIIAVILLQLDLMGDPFEYSMYREEAIDAVVRALDCWVFDEKIQEESARALLIMGGHFSYTGEPDMERWLLRRAGTQQNTDNSYGLFTVDEEDKTSENWQRKAAVVLFTSGNTRLLSALADSIANCIPCLARASLVTVCWMSSYLHSIGDKDLQRASCSILVPRLIECLNDNTSNMEEKILASFSLYGLTKGTDYMWRREKEILSCLEKLSRLTWTAKELISAMTSNSSHQFL